MVLVRGAKIATQKMNQPFQIPFQKRSVQAELLTQRCQAFRRGVCSQCRKRGITWYQVKSKIDEE